MVGTMHTHTHARGFVHAVWQNRSCEDGSSYFLTPKSTTKYSGWQARVCARVCACARLSVYFNSAIPTVA